MELRLKALIWLWPEDRVAAAGSMLEVLPLLIKSMSGACLELNKVRVV